jgi:N-acetylmuramoyl-L-alanine amidase
MNFVITAGHGDGDPGAVANGFTEAALMLELRDIVAKKLREYGHDVFTDGEPKQNRALRFALTLFGLAPIRLELHCNASVNSTANGVETISLPKDKALSQRLSSGVARVLGSRVRGDKGWIDQSQSARGRLAFVNNGGLILEVFFLTNTTELNTYRGRSWLVAEEIARTLIAARR